jgi:hypothetical protein
MIDIWLGSSLYSATKDDPDMSKYFTKTVLETQL